jgi:hypothetical protein
LKLSFPGFQKRDLFAILTSWLGRSVDERAAPKRANERQKRNEVEWMPKLNQHFKQIAIIATKPPSNLIILKLSISYSCWNWMKEVNLEVEDMPWFSSLT